MKMLKAKYCLKAALLQKNEFARFGIFKKTSHLCITKRHNAARGISSAGSEHLPYKQRVVGSNPTSPTLKNSHLARKLSGCFHFG